jgi:hypothetical protein
MVGAFYLFGALTREQVGSVQRSERFRLLRHDPSMSEALGFVYGTIVPKRLAPYEGLGFPVSKWQNLGILLPGRALMSQIADKVEVALAALWKTLTVPVTEFEA